MGESDPGVPEALPRMLRLVAERLSVESIDRLWIFPPRRRGRREWGLVVASAYRPDDGRRRVVTARYTAERSGRGLAFEPDLREEGTLPQERFPGLVAGVVRRAEEDLGDPRSVEVAGSAERFEALVRELEQPLSGRSEALPS